MHLKYLSANNLDFCVCCGVACETFMQLETGALLLSFTPVCQKIFMLVLLEHSPLLLSCGSVKRNKQLVMSLK